MRRLFPELAAARVYLTIAAVGGFLLAMISTATTLYRALEADLTPFQLVLVGTVLEGTILLGEVPTGVFADSVSRKRSVALGYALIGAGFAFEGMVPELWAILLAQVVWGLGYTFTSGAEQAWITDEVGERPVVGLFLRGAQLGQVGALAGTGVGVALATWRLNVPIALGGVLFIALAGWLLRAMPETNFQPAERHETIRGAIRGAGRTFRQGVRQVRGRPGLLAVLLAFALTGAASETFDRLWQIQFLREAGVPSGAEPIVWFGILSAAAQIVSIGVTEFTRRRINASVVPNLAGILSALALALALSYAFFGLAASFALGVIGFGLVAMLRDVMRPISAAFVNQGLDPRVRATVISMGGQTDALGQIAGGPALGAVASGVSLPAALVAAGAVVLPASAVYWRAGRHRMVPVGGMVPVDGPEAESAAEPELTRG